MLRQISEEMRVSLKDGLRDIRQGVRQIRHDSARAAGSQTMRPPFPIREIEGLLGHAAAAFDDAMSIAQTLIPRPGRGRRGGAALQSLDVYFSVKDAGQRGERAFRRDLYYLAQTVLAKRKIETAMVHEADLAAVHATMSGRHAARLEALASATMPAEKITAAAGVCAALLVALLERHPIRFAAAASDGSIRADRSAEIACLAPVALACGLATVETDDMADADLLDIAMLAADVRHDRIVEACGKADAVAALTAIFSVLLAHLP